MARNSATASRSPTMAPINATGAHSVSPWAARGKPVAQLGKLCAGTSRKSGVPELPTNSG